MKRVLVTGAGGFIGSHLAERCLELGCEVTAFVRYNSMSTHGWLERSPRYREFKIVSGDVRDFDSVSSAMKGCDTVFHLAALIGIPYSYVSPIAYVKTNVEGTYNVLQAALNQGLENVLVTSTSETYGSAQYVPIDEKHALVGQSPYSASKIGADQLAISYHRSFGQPVRIVRPFNTYGPRQSARAIIPTIATQLLSGAKRIRLGNLEPTRDLTFVLDTVEGFLAIAREKAFVGKVTNVGNGTEVSMGELAARIAMIMGVEAEIEQETARVRPAASEVDRLLCDNRQLLAGSSWKPQVSLDEGLGRTVEWIRANLPLYKPDVYNV